MIAEIDKTFNKIYPYMGYASVLIVIVFCILSFMDITSYTFSKAYQNMTLRANPNLLNKDAIDYVLLSYRKNNKDDEPYNIYLQQQITVWIYMFVGFIIVYIVLHNVVIILLKLLSKNTQDKSVVVDMKLSMTTPPEVINMAFFITIMLCLAIAYNALYNTRFSKRIKPDVIDIATSIKGITDTTYDNLSTDDEFLKSVLEGNDHKSYRIINRQGNRADKIGSMVFTMCLYSYYRKNTDMISNDTIKNIFTRNEIRLRRIAPFDYLYYNQTTFIPNLYEKIEPNILDVLNTDAKRAAVRENVASRLNNVNRRLVKMFRMSMIQSSIMLYLLLCFMISFTALVVLGMWYFRKYIIKRFSKNKINVKNNDV